MSSADIAQIQQENGRRKSVIVNGRKRKFSPSELISVPDKRAYCCKFDPLSCDLILQQVLKNLPVPQLLQCSLVNKHWKRNARSVLQKDKICFAYIHKCRPCKGLKLLNELLRTASDIPLNGLSINTKSKVFGHVCIKPPPGEDLEEFYSVIFEKLKFKYMEVNWSENTNCPAQDFLRKIMYRSAPYLQRLDVFRFPPDIENLTKEFGFPKNSPWLGNLKSLELSFEMDSNAKEEILAAAPNLVNLYGVTAPDDLEIIIKQNKAKTVREFDFSPHSHNISHCRAFACASTGLKRLTISSNLLEYEKVTVENLGEVLKYLTFNNSKSLDTLDVSQFNLILLHESVSPLENVDQLHLGYSPRIDQLQGCPILKVVNLGKIFPNLRTVEIHGEHFQGDFESVLKNLECPRSSNHCCPNVISLKVTPGFFHFDEQSLIYIASIFPNVQDFHVVHCLNVRSYLNVLSTSWQKLRSITFSNTDETFLNTNVDDIFCGISPEEVQRLKEQPLNFAKLQLPPSKASILNLKEITKIEFQIIFGEQSTGNRGRFLTEMANQLTFSRIPNLTVVIVPIQLKQCEDQPTGSNSDSDSD